MAPITIVGSGITGLAIASILSRDHDITIIARDIPGDTPSIDWASPWAGASFIAGGCSSPTEQKMQMDAFSVLWRWSAAYPESSIRRITIEDFFDDMSIGDKIWWKDSMPNFAFLPSDRLPTTAQIGITYKTVVFNPKVFLPWLKLRLQKAGVKFKRMNLSALAEAKVLGHEILINATGLGSKTLTDVRDQDVRPVRGQTMVVKSDYDKLFMHDNGHTYTYAIPRLDGTVILGGVRQLESVSESVSLEISQDIVRRLHDNLPDQFSANISDYEVVGYNVGLRPGRSSGIRLEKEVKDGQSIVHAYGFEGGGYIYSFGAARIVRDLVEDILFPYAIPKL